MFLTKLILSQDQALERKNFGRDHFLACEIIKKSSSTISGPREDRYTMKVGSNEIRTA
ncbi:MAG TPA: hypothetical protein PLH94_00925 [Fimbriimonadaceae bacterium]|nr:hypothetical protein [Fimbriimonadaceae bacterium]